METRVCKIIKIANKVVDIGVLFALAVLFFIGLYALYDSYLVYYGANDTSILKYKPGYEGEKPDKELDGNVVAWITIDDTNIDYPVMQGDTNTEYLNKDPFGEYSLSGSIFLDSRNKSDFSDKYSLVYGHHMDGGLMFGALDEYLDKKYFDGHRSGTLLVGDTTYESYDVNIFAVLEAEATNSDIFAPTETDVSDTINYIKKKSMYFDKTVDINGKNIIGLSTCKYPDTVERTLVFGTLSESK